MSAALRWCLAAALALTPANAVGAASSSIAETLAKDSGKVFASVLPWLEDSQPEEPIGARLRARRPLTAKELQDVYSISCLHAKQKDPDYPCSGYDEVEPEKQEEVELAITHPGVRVGSFPKPQDNICHSQGEYLCDADGMVKLEDMTQIAGELREMKEQMTVTCGRLEAQMTGNPKAVSTRPFNLGVVVIGKWPQNEGDDATLQKFGNVLMAQWGLITSYNGVRMRTPAPPRAADWRADMDQNCPNAALLIILADRNEAFFSAPSCEFLCSQRGGPEVVSAVERTLQRGYSLGDAIRAGISTVRTLLEQTWPLSLEEPLAVRERRNEFEMREWQQKFQKSDTAWMIIERGFLLFLVLIAVCVMGGVATAALAPAIPELRKAG